MAKLNIGKMPCETCNNSVTVKQNEHGTLSYRCDECDAAPYAKTGTLQNEHWRGKLTVLKPEHQNAHKAPQSNLIVDVATTTSKTEKNQPSELKPSVKLDMWGNPL